MSTGLECEFVRTANDEWFYAIQNWDCPVLARDWREYATCYGPFVSEDSAHEHLRKNHANPGGWISNRNKEGRSLGESWDRLIADALPTDTVRL